MGGSRKGGVTGVTVRRRIWADDACMMMHRDDRRRPRGPRLTAVAGAGVPSEETRSVFLTSAAGPVGRAAAHAFAAAGHGMAGLHAAGERGVPDVTALFGRLGQVGRMAPAVRSADCIVHIAGPRDGSRGAALAHIADTGELLEVWHRGTFVYLSTMAVYGTPRDAAVETDPPSPQSWPAVAAYTNERQLAMTTPCPRRGGAVVLRAAPLMDPDLEAVGGGLLEELVAQVRDGRSFVFESAMALSSHGIAFIGARDLARALVTVSDARRDATYNVASGFTTWRDLLETIGRALDMRPRMTIRPDLVLRPEDVLLPPSRVSMRTEAFEKAYGFTPEETLEDLVQKAVDAAVGGGKGGHLRAVT